MLRIVLLIFVTGCTSTPEYVVSKSAWLECWSLCGKKDRLLAVTETECLCTKGKEKRTMQLPLSTGKNEETPFAPFDFLSIP